MPILRGHVLLDLSFLSQRLVKSDFSVLNIDILLICLDIRGYIRFLLTKLVVSSVGSIRCSFIEDRFALVEISSFALNRLASTYSRCLIIAYFRFRKLYQWACSTNLRWFECLASFELGILCHNVFNLLFLAFFGMIWWHNKTSTNFLLLFLIFSPLFSAAVIRTAARWQNMSRWE